MISNVGVIHFMGEPPQETVGNLLGLSYRVIGRGMQELYEIRRFSKNRAAGRPETAGAKLAA